MRIGSLEKRRILCTIAVLVLSLIIAGTLGSVYGADDDSDQTITYTSLRLDEKKIFTLKWNPETQMNDYKFFEIKIPENGNYKIYQYGANRSDSRLPWCAFDLYKSKEDVENGKNVDGKGTTGVRWRRTISVYNDPSTSCQIYYLKAGTYYISAWTEGGTRKDVRTGIKVSGVTEEDLWETGLLDLHYAGEKDLVVGAMRTGLDNSGICVSEGTVVSVTSKSKRIATVKKSGGYFHVNFKASGKAKLIIKYKRPGGKKEYTIVQIINVKRYPGHIKNLKVNGKKISTKKNKFDCNVKKSRKTFATIKMQMKKGWKITHVYCTYMTKNGYADGKEIKPEVIKKGKKISFPKKYTEIYVDVGMSNSNGFDALSYTVHIER